MERVDLAERLFRDGYSCAQSLLAAFGPGLGLDRDAALRLASPFAGGVSRTGGPCGAGTGGLLVLGLACGADTFADEDKARITGLSQEFLRRFRDRHGSVFCTDILGHDLSLPGVPERVKAEGLSDPVCPSAVRAAGEILLDLLPAASGEGATR
ncbi:MAG TPA: C-GCAxxG-C-C family protein [Candidatus Krumholzibacteria bacterium]|nr:C-GCAxxG-C-C family protein [Candidatus Krumholzibacteria bacterium]HRX49930.1 C-GCAxxG-C-C family protein [Candidatus Krumholzibacteria bacterium]